MGLQVNNEHLLQLNLILGYNFYKQLLFYQRQVYKLCKLNVQAEFTMKTSCKEAQSAERETTEEIRHKGNDMQAEETR